MSVKYNIDYDGDKIQLITTDFEIPFVYFEMMVRTSVKLGINHNDMLLLALDYFFQNSELIKKVNEPF